MLNEIIGFIGVLLLLIVPGFALTLALFPGKELKLLERMLLAVLLSVTAIPFLLLLENKVLGIKIDALSSAANTVLVIAFAIAVYIARKKGLVFKAKEKK